LHHPRGTVEQIAGPFSDQEQAKSDEYTNGIWLLPEFHTNGNVEKIPAVNFSMVRQPEWGTITTLSLSVKFSHTLSRHKALLPLGRQLIALCRCCPTSKS